MRGISSLLLSRVGHLKRVALIGLPSVLCVFLINGCGQSESTAKVDKPVKKPNIIWLVMEDISPDIGSYGNQLVHTPNLDKLAAEGIRYTNAYATSPVCSPARSAFFTGMYQTSIGAHHHRSHLDDGYQLPQGVKFISEHLREVGYVNLLMGPKQKTDFNFTPHVAPFDATDGKQETSGGAYTHAPVDQKILAGNAWSEYPGDQPFFAQINYSEAHRTFIHDPENPIAPADVTLPSYYPDHSIARRDWALYLETIQVLDKKIGNLMAELDKHELLDNTIIFIFGDHGRAMLRDKQWLYDGGIKVPMIVWGPGFAEQGIEAGKVSDELVSLIDLMPTTLDLVDVDVPEGIQGKIFLGENKVARDYIFAQRDRCDEVDDRIRAVRDKRFKYIRNDFPEQPYTAFSTYKKVQYPVMTLMEKLHKEGKLTPVQAQFMAASRPAEELYDTVNDPDEVNNLADNPDYQDVLKTMRTELNDWQLRTGDQGLQPEDPGVVAYWDKFFKNRYQQVMNQRGLAADISHDDYLAWWDKELKRLGK